MAVRCRRPRADAPTIGAMTGRTRAPRTRWFARTGALLLLLAGSLAGCAGAPANPLAGIEVTPGEGSVWIVLFGPEPDLRKAYEIADWDARGQFVVDELHRVASTAQADARKMLDEVGIAAKSYWAVNGMSVVGPDALGTALGKLPGVVQVYAEPLHQRVLPPNLTPVPAPAAGYVPPALTAMNVPQVWAAGDRGAGVTIGIIDSGVDASHPALAPAYAGASPGGVEHDYHWFDATGVCRDVPCDDEGHGTHVAGIVVANAVGDSPAIGVAPDARWIAAKACAKGTGCSVPSLLDAAQFMLAPTTRSGENPTPGKRPHVLNNSWELGKLDASVDRLVKVWEAANIQPVFAAGNSGPDCESVGEPSSVDAAMAVGAVDAAGVALPSSGRGAGVNGITKPDVVAPGEAIVSTMPGGSWAAASGTSAAAPHVSGLVALALAAGAAPDRTDELITRTARALPADGCASSGHPNNTTGWGLPDAPALVAAARAGGR